METNLNILLENATWKVDHEFVSPAGVLFPNSGEWQFKVFADKIQWKRFFVDDYGDKIIVNQDVQKIDEYNYEYETNDIAGIGSMKGTINVERSRLFTNMHIGNTPINGFEVTIREGDKCYAYGALYYVNNLIKTWNATLVKVSK